MANYVPLPILDGRAITKTAGNGFDLPGLFDAPIQGVDINQVIQKLDLPALQLEELEALIGNFEGAFLDGNYLTLALLAAMIIMVIYQPLCDIDVAPEPPPEDPDGPDDDDDTGDQIYWPGIMAQMAKIIDLGRGQTNGNLRPLVEFLRRVTVTRDVG